MYRHLLSKEFFDANPYAESSAQRIIYSTILMDGIEELADKAVIEHGLLSEDRMESLMRERERIKAARTPDEIIRLMRINIEMSSRRILREQALKYEADVLQAVLETLSRSYNDIFIENAIKFLARAKGDCVAQLMQMYPDMRYPYAQSLICIVLGYKAQEDAIPWMLDEYRRLKRLYPNDNYDQGPLIALNEMAARFYSK